VRRTSSLLFCRYCSAVTVQPYVTVQPRFDEPSGESRSMYLGAKVMLQKNLAFASVLSLMIFTPGLIQAQPPQDAMLYVARTMGFRPASFMTPQSDYGFEINEKGEWKYNSFAPRKGQEGPQTGKLKMPMESFLEQLKLIGLDDIPEPDPNEPQIADLPTMMIRRTVDGKPWVREIPPRSEEAMKLHYLIQTIVLGVKEIPAKDFPLVNDEALGVDKPIEITTMAELEKTFGDKAKELSRHLDFEKQKMVIFRWAGSGQDELFVSLEGEDDGEQLVFGYRGGMTRDLRQHARYYIVDKASDWSVTKLPPARFDR
jgi:hypothetical protein